MTDTSRFSGRWMRSG